MSSFTLDKEKKEPLFHELLILAILGALFCLLHQMHGYKIVILNLFFLPISLSGFLLGRYRTGALAFLAVLGASAITALEMRSFAQTPSPLIIVMSLAIWGAALGLCAIVIGGLSDDRSEKVRELHDAYVGVVEVLSQYLQSAHPRLKARSIQVAELSQQIATRLKLSPQDTDDIRVAALLYDVGNLEITTRIIRRAVDNYGVDDAATSPTSFPGADLMVSLGEVLRGAVPLILAQSNGGDPDSFAERANEVDAGHPIGAQIIRATRSYLNHVDGAAGDDRCSPADAVEHLQKKVGTAYNSDVIAALKRVVTESTPIACEDEAVGLVDDL